MEAPAAQPGSDILMETQDSTISMGSAVQSNVSDSSPHLHPRSGNRGLQLSSPLPPKSDVKALVIDRYHKRGRVESVGCESGASSRNGEVESRLHASTVVMASDPSGDDANDRFGSPRRGLAWGGGTSRRRAFTQRSSSLPNIRADGDDASFHNIFPDLNPRELRLAEVRSWHCSWMNGDGDDTTADANNNTTVHNATSGVKKEPLDAPLTKANNKKSEVANATLDIDNVIEEISQQFSLEEKVARDTVSPLPVPPTSSPPGSKSLKRPTLRLKLEDMPTPQQAEDRAQRAATRTIARREMMEKVMAEGKGNGDAAAAANGGVAPRTSASQQAMMRLNFKSYSSGDESDVASPSGRHSVGSAYSPNHGMFTTKTVAVSEAGIASPDTPSLHLQENLERVREIGRGASGVVYKAIHIPTLKVVAVKDVPVYGRGQRRQMVRELHALYSNLVPIADSEDNSGGGGGSRPHRPSNGKPRASPYIVSFYDAFVDRAKNCICLVMECMSAGSLQDIVLRGGCQNEKVLSRLAAGVLHGLSHIHSKRMVHRDIKPHNLLANRQGEVKISDFGLAKTLNDNAGVTKTFVGTLLYMAPERIGGGDYSYPADIWSFGLALVSVALGKYPLPTQDGFFGLVDSVANEKYLELPADQFSIECRQFLQLCLHIEPTERPTADALLQHPFITKYSNEDTLKEWTDFIEATELCEDRTVELDSLGEAVYRHVYERNVKFTIQPQSDYGVSFVTQSAPSLHRREISIHPVQMSLQLGLANHLGLPVHTVYELFERKRGYYNDKLLEDYCYSPQSWTASPGLSRRQQLFGSDSESPRRAGESARGLSFWKKLQDGLTKFKSKRKKNKEAKASENAGGGARGEEGGDRLSSRTATR